MLLSRLQRALAFMLALALAHAADADERPNILLIIADDMTWSDLGYEGNKDVRTPNLDQLSRESMHLTRMFTPASTCSPSRHAIYTGLFPIRSGAYPNHTRVFDGTNSVFTYLKDAGYRVALQNKTHVGPPKSFPYEHIVGADDLTETEAFINRDSKQPWFLAYASNDPHSPWSRGPKNLYDPAKLTVPAYLHDNETTRQGLAKYYAEITALDTQVGSLMKMLDSAGQRDQTLVMFVSEQGSGFPTGGKWSLYDTGIRASTLVRWPEKIRPGTKSDALIQYVDITPTFLDAAGINPATIDVGCPDADKATGFDGMSMLSLLRGETDVMRDAIFAQHTTVGIIGYKQPYPIRAVRDSRYKLIRNLANENTYSINGIHESAIAESWQKDATSDSDLAAKVDWLFHRPAVELYDVENDPYEMKNLAGNAELAEVEAALQSKLDEWMRQQGDKGMETELMAESRQGNGKAKAAQTDASAKKRQRKKGN